VSRVEELRRLALAWNDAWNGGDVARLTAFFAPDSTFYEPNLSAPMPGVEGVKASAEKTWADWPGAVFDAVTITIEESRVVVEWRTSAVHRSGLEHLLEGVDVLEVEGDRVTACRIYYDTRVQRAPGGGAARPGPHPARAR
jgi:ketosteroid isomerase-like protein